MKKKLLIIDNSIAFTGAFKCALTEALVIADHCETIFIIPANCSLDEQLTREKITSYKLPLLEIGKSLKKLFLYLPFLVINGLRIRKLVRKHGIEYVQVNDFYNLLGAFLKFTGTKVKLITYVRFLPASLPGPLRKIWTRAAIKYSHKVVCVSQAVKKQMPNADNVTMIYDALLFEEHIDQRETKDTGHVNFLYVANYISGKGQNFALEAFNEAFLINKHITLQFAGGDMGMDKNREFRQMLVNRANELGLSDVVSFLPFTSETERLIKSADVVLNFSESESFSMTCAEAAYFGRPVIATKCGGPEEIIVDNETGLLVANRNTDEMRDAILKLAAYTPDKRAEMGRRSKVYVTEKFSVSVFLQAFNKLIN